MIGAVIDTLMRARAMTQLDLAEALGVTQATISRYISGSREPRDDELIRIAEVLGVSKSFLQHDFKLRSAISVNAHMRRQRTTRVKEWKRAEAQLNTWRMHLAMLTSTVPLQANEVVPRYDYAYASPKQAAIDTRTAWRVPLGPIRSISALLEAAGVIIIDTDLGTQRIDGMSQWVGDFPIIILNRDMAPSRRRMTLAHELGHLILHGDGYIDDGIDVEDQANEFAAEFLMPETEIRSQLRNAKPQRLIALKREWGVSIQALFERKYRLGLATANERTAFYKTINSKGWRTHEPIEDEVFVETPKLAPSLLESFKAAGLTEKEFATAAGFAPGNIPAELRPKQPHLQLIG